MELSLTAEPPPSLRRPSRRRPRTASPARPVARNAQETPPTDALLVTLAKTCADHRASRHRRPQPCGEECEAGEDCQRGLAAWRKTLPRIEATQRPPADLRHVCDFYASAVEGHFCPFAPHLFGMGRNINDILPHALYLLGHYLERSMLSHMVASLSASSPHVGSSIASACGQLLALTVQHRLQVSLLTDLVDLLADLQVVAMSDIDAVVEIVLFPSTTAATGGSELVWQLSSREAVAGLHAGVAATLVATVQARVARRVESLDVAVAFDEHDGRRSADAYLVELDSESTTVVLATLQAILTTPLPTERRLGLLRLQGQASAAELLGLMTRDWLAMGVDEAVGKTAARMVAVAVRVHGQSTRSGLAVEEQYAQRLAVLLSTLLLYPPSCRMASSDYGKSDVMVLDELAGAVETLRCERPQVDDQNRVLEDERSLSVVILQVFHKQLASQSAWRPSPAVITRLVELLNDPLLSPGSVAILLQLQARARIERVGSLYQSSLSDSKKRRSPDSDSPIAKRQKLNDSTAASKPASFPSVAHLEEQLAGLFVNAHLSIDDISNALSSNDVETPALLVNATMACNTLLLLVASFKELSSDLMALFDGLLEVIVLLLAYAQPRVVDGDKQSVLAHLSNVLVGCLVLGDALGHTCAGSKSRMSSVLDASKSLYWILTAKRVDDTSVPQVTVQVLVHAAIMVGSDSDCATLSIFDGSTTVVLTAHHRAATPRTRQRIGFIGLPVTAEEGLQRLRLLFLNLKGGLDDKSKNADVVAETLQVISLSGDDIDSNTRLIRWQSLAWLLASLDAVDLRLRVSEHGPSDGGLRKKMVVSLLQGAFADQDENVRDFASRELGRLVRFRSPCLLALLVDDADWGAVRQELTAHGHSGRRPACASAFAGFFKEIDKLLHRQCSVPQSQLYFTVASASLPKSIAKEPSALSDDDIISFRRSAARSLTSMAAFASLEHRSDRIAFEESMRRVLGLLSSPVGSLRHENSGLCLGELAVLQMRTDFGKIVREQCLATFAPALFHDMLIPTVSFLRDQAQLAIESIPTPYRERQYRLLSVVISRFLSQSMGESVGLLTESTEAVSEFLVDAAPAAVARLVIEQDYDALRLATGFKLYVQSEDRNWQKMLHAGARGESLEGLVVGVNSAAKGRQSRVWSLNLEDQLRQLCLTPDFIERILPSIFLNAGREELTFFTRTVLQKTSPLKQIISMREQLILKGLIWELGRDPDMTESALRAIKTAAVARSDDHSSLSMSSVDNKHGSRPAESCEKEWVSSHFMYLMVNVVQHRWHSRSVSERLQALQCLGIMLKLLIPTESSRFLPQILATVNAAIEEDVSKADETQLMRCELHLRAVETLAVFLDLVAISNWGAIGQNLTTIVVSLIPVLEDTAMTNVWPSRGSEFISAARRAAVALLIWLTSGELGKRMARFFKQVPFLPPSPELGTVRASLRANGVDFDDLQVSTTQGTQLESIGRSDGGSASVSTAEKSSRRQEALRQRLELVRPMLENENASVRRVALQHLSGLLRSNREIFHLVVDNEDTMSMKRYVTVAYDGKGLFRGTVTEIMDSLLLRCVVETDAEAIVLVAECLGEVGAIDSHRLEEARPKLSSDVDTPQDFRICRLSSAPWRSRRNRYELALVTNHLVAALKAAPSSSEQHRIAYCIQQILVLLDKSGRESEMSAISGSTKHGGDDGAENKSGNSKPPMNDWLKAKISEAGVLDTVEPFWSSEFLMIHDMIPKQPPFSEQSSTYHSWISNWCTYMVYRSSEAKTVWSDLFFACRTAIRSYAGLNVAEFLLPLLILDRLCFGDNQDERVIVKEIKDTLTVSDNSVPRMPHIERQKAVSVVFSTLDTLQVWSEEETEKRHQKSRPSPAKTRDVSLISGEDWAVDESVMRIEDLLQAIPLVMRSKAAANIGMNARALRLLEMASRQEVVKHVFDATGGAESGWDRHRSRAAGTCPETELDLMKEVLIELYDYETMASLEDDQFRTRSHAPAVENGRQKEAMGDWEGALQDFERAQQLSGPGHRDPSVQRGSLRCLLELGHFEGVLNQVSGIAREGTNVEHAVSLGTEAAWRLGRWETLSELVDLAPKFSSDPETLYQLSLGQAMLAIRDKDRDTVKSRLKQARRAVMMGLSGLARESYTRAYDQIVRLQTLSEIEDASDALCSDEPLDLESFSSGVGWTRRLDFLSTDGATSVIKTRLALSRLASDTAYEGSLFLSLGRQARKLGHINIAANSFAQAEAALSLVPTGHRARLEMSTLQMQVAKLKHASGESNSALRILGQDDLEKLSEYQSAMLHSEVVRRVCRVLRTDSDSMTSEQMVEVFVRRTLQSTRWMIEGSLKGGNEIMNRFRTIHRLAPKWEKGHFQFAKYTDSLLESRVLALQRRSPDIALGGVEEEKLRGRCISCDKTCQRYTLLAIKHYFEALSLNTKHVYQALPRLLSLWFELTSLTYSESVELVRSLSVSSEKPTGLDSLATSQDEANTFMALQFRRIPSHAFYTAIPQLISRVIHDDEDTQKVVREILKRVLARHPAQAMWPLGWLRNSKQADRCKAGDILFAEAERKLLDSRNEHYSRLLVASKSLFDYLQALAKYNIKDSSQTTITVKAWKGEVALADFIPPTQAALSVSMSSGDSGRSKKELFPRQVPRMRAFSDQVAVMSSKARPKRLTAFLVMAHSSSAKAPPGGARWGQRRTGDIGEIHFLVKQEARGDLRKDARVQDLNNVVNRLLSSSESSKSAPRHGRRRLHLRTFEVTCLSEDTGILEWVPNTESMRSLIAKSYNPQACPFSNKRRGKRGATFGDPMLRSNFETKCQDMFLSSGNLKRAATMFEELCLKPNPPLLYWWFVKQFQDPHGWFEARSQFVLSAAAWSAIGHVIGLGDRHSENILIDTTTGACVHVDFDCIFDKGLTLPKPEVVPFRLTQNMLDAFGPTGADGVFTASLHTAMGCLRSNRDTLLSVLEPFVKDPVIDWRRYRSQQTKGAKSSTTDKQTQEAKRSINSIDERLMGMYNIKNPNFKRVRRTDGGAADEDDSTHLVPLSVEGQVHKMIAEATSHENLVQLYVGWMPWV